MTMMCSAADAGGESLADSPYLVAVSADAAAPRKCTATGAGCAAAASGCASQFSVEVRDQHGNRSLSLALPRVGLLSCCLLCPVMLFTLLAGKLGAAGCTMLFMPRRASNCCSLILQTCWACRCCTAQALALLQLEAELTGGDGRCNVDMLPNSATGEIVCSYTVPKSGMYRLQLTAADLGRGGTRIHIASSPHSVQVTMTSSPEPMLMLTYDTLALVINRLFAEAWNAGAGSGGTCVMWGRGRRTCVSSTTRQHEGLTAAAHRAAAAPAAARAGSVAAVGRHCGRFVWRRWRHGRLGL